MFQPGEPFLKYYFILNRKSSSKQRNYSDESNGTCTEKLLESRGTSLKYE